MDFSILDDYVPPNIVKFLKNILVRHPSKRYTARHALDDDVFYQEIYDEGSKVLSFRMKKLRRPKM